jgi:hypothetical protein
MCEGAAKPRARLTLEMPGSRDLTSSPVMNQQRRPRARRTAPQQALMHSFATPNDSRSGQLSELFPEGNGLSILCVGHRHRRCAHSYADPIRLQRVSSALVRSGGKTVASQRRDEELRGNVTSPASALAYATLATPFSIIRTGERMPHPRAHAALL